MSDRRRYGREDPFPSGSPWDKPGEHLLARLRTHKALADGYERRRFWDLRVNWVVGEWLRAGKPGLDQLEAEGFGNIRYGSSTAGPLIPLVDTLALRVKANVTSDLPFSRGGVRAGSVFVGDQIEINPHGAVAVPASDGKLLGLKPAEWEWIDAAEGCS